jgi:hypothetical protein
VESAAGATALEVEARSSLHAKPAARGPIANHKGGAMLGQWPITKVPLVFDFSPCARLMRDSGSDESDDCYASAISKPGQPEGLFWLVNPYRPRETCPLLLQLRIHPSACGLLAAHCLAFPSNQRSATESTPTKPPLAG